jgi:hypothetical protein
MCRLADVTTVLGFVQIVTKNVIPDMKSASTANLVDVAVAQNYAKKNMICVMIADLNVVGSTQKQKERVRIVDVNVKKNIKNVMSAR